MNYLETFRRKYFYWKIPNILYIIIAKRFLFVQQRRQRVLKVREQNKIRALFLETFPPKVAHTY